MLKKLIDRARAIREFQRFLYRSTPLRDGREVRKIARLIRYDADTAVELAEGAVDFEPRQTYPMRAAQWAKGRRRG